MMAIDGRPALEVFKEDIGELLSRDLRRVGGLIFAGLPVAGSDTGDYLVRNLIAIDVRATVAGRRATRSRRATGAVLPARRAERRVADLKRMLGQLKRRTGGAAQGRALFQLRRARPQPLRRRFRASSAMVREALGEFPLVGFFGNGEISSDRLYGYTARARLVSLTGARP